MMLFKTFVLVFCAFQALPQCLYGIKISSQKGKLLSANANHNASAKADKMFETFNKDRKRSSKAIRTGSGVALSCYNCDIFVGDNTSGSSPGYPWQQEDGQNAQPKCAKVQAVCAVALTAAPATLLKQYPVLSSLKCCAFSSCFPLPVFPPLGLCVGIPGFG